MSRFWRALHQLTGVDLKLSSAYHPQTDGSSEHTNKTVVQSIRFAVERDQRGWVLSLPKVRFNLMNTHNASTGFSPFQLRFGKSPRILPPITSRPTPDVGEPNAQAIIDLMRPLELEASDHLLAAKVSQAYHANQHRDTNFPYKKGNKVLLSTKHRRHAYNHPTATRAAKFFPRFDGPYTITHANERNSTVTLELHL